jgi:hypothetical protein
MGVAVLGLALAAGGAGAAADGEASDAGSPAASAEDYAGTWAHLRVQAAIVDIPILGEVEVVTRTILRLEVSVAGRSLSISAEGCAIEQDMSTSMLRAEYPQGMIQGEGRIETTGSLREKDGELQFFQPRRWLVFGAQLDDPGHDTLPTDAADERLVDVDHDGHPGMTVHFEGMVSGDVYQVQRQWTTLRGVASGGNRIDGRIQWGEERSVLDATSVFLRTQPPSRPDPDPEASYFRTTRIEADVDCAGILAQRDTLFAR